MTADGPSRELTPAHSADWRRRARPGTELRHHGAQPVIRSVLAGTVVMAAFQKLVEMPITGRGHSYAPANAAEKTCGVHPETQQGRERLNYAAHFALGTVWGAAYGAAAHAGLRRLSQQPSPPVYTGDFVSNTARLYDPSTWSRQDWAIDLPTSSSRPQPQA